MDSSFGKCMVAFLSGAALGVTIGILYAPDKGERTRKKIVKKSKDFKDAVTDRLEDLVESAEEIVDELKDSAADFIRKNEEAAEEAKNRRAKAK